MPKPWIILAIICPLAVACAPLTNLIIPAPTSVPTPTPTPTPAPDPCSAEAMAKLVEEIKSLSQRYMDSTQNDESWVPLLPDLMALRRDVTQFLNLPRCADKLKATVTYYTDLDAEEIQHFIDGLTTGSIEDAIESARYWLETKIDLPTQNNQ